ncbi:hypothetical protein Sjap_003658 [Stephania japonica]|uniref:Uncharacterized protein n=1 Tax=Stephania japonica TaxID=461633 RepID=A0AAP0KP86_9MAGN
MMIERVITVEYLEPSMSRELLRKFPDNTAFDFDYSQSGIWSPLLPQRGHTTALLSVSPIEFRRKLFDGLENRTQISNNKRSKSKSSSSSNNSSAVKISSAGFGFDYSQSGIWSPLLPRSRPPMGSLAMRRKLFDGLEKVHQNRLSNVAAKIKKKMIGAVITRKDGIRVAHDHEVSVTPKKGWGRALKAASRQFKKNRAHSLQIKLPNFLKIGDF